MKKRETGHPPIVNTGLCVGCGSCEAVCAEKPNVFKIVDEIAIVVEPDSCIGCDMCVIICPVNAIERI